MKSIVLIKQVPETGTVKMDSETGTMIRDGVASIINPLDLYAIETALLLKETRGGTVTVLTMGPPKSEKALREAIAMGCDDALLLSDKAFAGADTWATSFVLSEAIRQKAGDFDLILCGERATDGDTGQVGPGVASFLDLPIVTYASSIDLCNAATARVTRLVEGGREVLRLPFPALLTVVKEISFPRLPTLRGKRKARTLDIIACDAEALQLQRDRIGLKGSPTRVVRIFSPKIMRECRKVTVDEAAGPGPALEVLLDFLNKKQGLLP